MLERLKQPETRSRIRDDIERDGLNNWGRIPSWDCVQISISPNRPETAGKTPRRLPQSKQTQSELVQLRKQLLQAVNKEAYEEAAQLRDRIRKLEEG